MSITYSRPKDGRRLATIDAQWNRHYTVLYRAVTSDPNIGQLAVMRACPVGLGSVYVEGSTGTLDYDSGSWVQSITPETESDDGRSWIVRVEYGPREPVDENPLARKPEIAWDYVAIDEIIDEDQTGAAVLNTAYDYFDPPLTRPVFLPTVTVRRNEAVFPYDLAFSFEDGVNNADFLASGDVGKWKVNKITASTASVPYTTFGASTTELIYWVVSYELQYNPKGWKKQVLNQGMRQLKTGGGSWEPILDKGQPISSPALLNSAGRVLSPGGSPLFLEFVLNPDVDFSTLNFAGIDFGQGPI